MFAKLRLSALPVSDNIGVTLKLKNQFTNLLYGYSFSSREQVALTFSKLPERCKNSKNT